MAAQTSEPTFFLFSARTFDGTTPMEGPLTPPSGVQPRFTKDADILGRLSFKDLLRPGSHGAFITARAWQGPEGTIRVRSVNEDEATEPLPRSLDQALEDRPLNKSWCKPLLLGPTDALCLSQNLDGGGDIEVMRIDAQASAALEYMNAKFMECCDDDEGVAEITVEETGQLDKWSGWVYILINGDPGTVVELPPTNDMVDGAGAMIVRVGGGYAVVRPVGGFINGQNADVSLGGFESTIIRFVDGGWLSTKETNVPVVTLQNTVAGETVNLPTLIGRQMIVVLDWDEPGFLALPSLVLNPVDGEYLIQRAPSGGREQATLKPAAGEIVNGIADGQAFMGWNDVLRVRAGQGSATAHGWTVLGESLNEDQVQVVAAGNVTLKPWGKRLKVVRLTEAAAQTVTLPAIADCPDGAELLVIAEGAAGTVARAGAPEVIKGLTASGNSVAVPQNTGRRLTASGTNWTVL